MKKKTNALNDLKTWEPVGLSGRRNAIKTKWVYDYKQDRQKSNIGPKARMLRKCLPKLQERTVLRFFVSFSEYVTIRFMLVMSVQLSWKRKLIDRRNAFVNANLFERKYFVQSEGLEK